ncbi:MULTISPECIES: hypothetical protein [Pseudomonas]|nr:MULTISPECIES: hypothetical protein [Pseudomonas]
MLRCVALASDVAKSYPGNIKSQGTEQDGGVFELWGIPAHPLTRH